MTTLRKNHVGTATFACPERIEEAVRRAKPAVLAGVNVSEP